MSGIIDFEVTLPSGLVSVGDMQRWSGLSEAELLAVTHVEKIPVLAEHEQAWDLATRAARTVLARNDVPPEAIGQVIYCGTGQWDPPLWSPAAKVADELGIRRAHCYEVLNFCNCTSIALRLASDEIALGRSEYVLMLLGDRLSQFIDYSHPDSKGVFNFGDAPAAVLLGPDGDLQVVHTEMRTDPSWCDFYFGEIDDYRIIGRRRDLRTGIGAAYIGNFTRLTKQALEALGREISDIAYFLINHSDKTVHTVLLERLGIPQDRSVFNYHRLGHMGGADPFIALEELRENDRLTPGDLILLATSGVGFTWGITALEYRPRT